MPATIFKPEATSHNRNASRLELAMLSTRYAWAAGNASGKDVAEIACGTGVGLGWISRMARSVNAGDPHDTNCHIAKETYAGHQKIRVRRMDAFDLPFADRSLDLVLRLDGIDDLPGADLFLGEARRVLRRGGTLLIATANREFFGFRPSAHYTRDFSASDVKNALARGGFEAHLRAGFPSRRGILTWAPLRRLFQGPLAQIPRQLEPGRHPGAELITISPGMNLRRYRTLYIEGRKTS